MLIPCCLYFSFMQKFFDFEATSSIRSTVRRISERGEQPSTGETNSRVQFYRRDQRTLAGALNWQTPNQSFLESSFLVDFLEQYPDTAIISCNY